MATKIFRHFWLGHEHTTIYIHTHFYTFTQKLAMSSGKAFAFFGLCQAAAPLIFTPIASFIYREASEVTIDIFVWGGFTK